MLTKIISLYRDKIPIFHFRETQNLNQFFIFDDFHVFLEIARIFTQHFILDVYLVVGLQVHEDIALVGTVIQELHVPLLKGQGIDLLVGPEAIERLIARPEITELGMHHPAPLAGGDMVQLHDAVEGSLMVDHHPDPELSCRNHRRGLLAVLGVVRAVRGR